MADNPQSFTNHTRWHPPFHFFVLPVLLINLIWSIVVFVKTPGWSSGWWVVVSLALAMLALFVRTYAIRLQDRLIQLEEKVRYQRILPPAILQQTSALALGQVIALRFASDDELEELVDAVLAGRLTKTKDIKQAVKNWRADTFRV